MAEKAGPRIKRIAVTFEAGRDGFWLARWLRARGTDAHVILASSRGGATRSSFRAKTDRLDTARLKRAFLGWPRRTGARQDGRDPDDRRRQPSREPESLVGEHGPIVNGMKAALAPLGLRDFNPKRNKAADRLEDLCTPDGEPIPPNTLSARRCDLERRRLIMLQIGQRETARLARLPQAPKTKQAPHKAAFTFRWRSVGRLSRHADCRESLIYGGFLHVGSLKSAASERRGP
jgi:transposase